MTQHTQPREAAARDKFLKAIALHRQGKIDPAEKLYREILDLAPDFADALQMLGVVASLKGRHDEAVALISKAIDINPRFAGYHFNLAKAREGLGEDSSAERAYRRAIQLEPGNPSAWLNLSSLMLRRPDFEAAAKLASEAQRLRPDSVAALNNLGVALSHLVDHEADAERALRHALKLDPKRAETHVNLARLLSLQDRYEEATPLLRKAVSLAPASAEAYNNLANTLKYEGRLDEALDCSRKALELKPNAGSHSQLLFNLNYYPKITPDALFREHVAWAARHASGLAEARKPCLNERTSNRKLRIGYLSPDFRKHPVATFLQGIIPAHDRERFEVFCYASVMKSDELTDWFKARCDTWRDILGMADDQIAERIRADRIDILVELAGHTSGNRLLALARKPAPVQVSYLGYLGTTGLDAIDYKLTDAMTDPPGLTDSFYTEKLVRLPQGMWCYTAPEDAPDLAPIPSLRKGHITFASFNNSAKITPEVVAVWSQILRRVGDARLIMLTKGEGNVHEHFRSEFARHGIAPERLDLRSRMIFPDFLALHNEVDIALDPFPYTGATTTCHALWMGVPVLTLPADRPFSRSSAGILSILEMGDWIARSEENYVEIAVAKAEDQEGLRRLRPGLRERMRKSPLMDGDAFTRGLEEAYRRMWRAWLDSEANNA